MRKGFQIGSKMADKGFSGVFRLLVFETVIEDLAPLQRE
jgi:hypothetical protein